jgi:hypothetical protein
MARQAWDGTVYGTYLKRLFGFEEFARQATNK